MGVDFSLTILGGVSSFFPPVGAMMLAQEDVSATIGMSSSSSGERDGREVISIMNCYLVECFKVFVSKRISSYYLKTCILKPQ